MEGWRDGLGGLKGRARNLRIACTHFTPLPCNLELTLTPTQIFDELRKVGRRHDLSAGLLIGGKDVKEEQERVHGACMRARGRGRCRGGGGSIVRLCAHPHRKEIHLVAIPGWPCQP